jgi:hypothetical protein
MVLRAISSARVAGLCGLLLLAAPAFGAENLRLREGVSFVHDLDKGFPIIADRMDDVELSTTRPTVLFFGAAGDLNTNRQAKRIVELYKKYKDKNVKFIVIDVDHPTNPAAKALIKAHYQGYIPFEAVFDKTGAKKYSHSGEVESNALANQIEKL